MLPEIEERVRFLHDVQIFNELDDAALARIADRLKPIQYAAGEIIFHEGDEPDNLYFVAKGKVRVFRTDEQTEAEIELAIFDVGDSFGIDALHFERERSATVVAFTDIDLYYLDFEDWEWLKVTFSKIEPYLDAFLSTFEIARKLRIDWLGEGEYINLITRRDPIRLVGEFLAMLVFLFLDITVMLGIYIFIKSGFFLNLVLIFGGSFGLLAVIAMIWAWAEWRNDYFIVTNVRVVWRERILFRGTSRQETPLRTIQSLNIQTGNFFHRSIHVGDLIVRTFNSELRMTDVHYPEHMKELIEGFILRSRRRSQREQLAEIRRTIRRRLDIQREEILPEEPEKVPPVVVKKYGRFAIFKTRIVEEGSITYRKHWSVFIKNALLPNILFGSAMFTAFFVAPVMMASGVGWGKLLLGFSIFLAVIFFFWWFYEYEDWRNDLYRVTGDLIIDRDKKPFGKESFRSAPIKNIQSLGHEVPNVFGLILNVGNVKINVGDETFTFDGVHDPAVVHQDISRRMEELIAKQEKDEVKKENERMATWLEIYHQETEDQRFPWRNLDS
jgi:hypothetical protein